MCMCTCTCVTQVGPRLQCIWVNVHAAENAMCQSAMRVHVHVYAYNKMHVISATGRTCHTGIMLTRLYIFVHGFVITLSSYLAHANEICMQLESKIAWLSSKTYTIMLILELLLVIPHSCQFLDSRWSWLISSWRPGVEEEVARQPMRCCSLIGWPPHTCTNWPAAGGKLNKIQAKTHNRKSKGSRDCLVIKRTWLLDVEPARSFQTTLQDESLQTTPKQ